MARGDPDAAGKPPRTDGGVRLNTERYPGEPVLKQRSNVSREHKQQQLLRQISSVELISLSQDARRQGR
jgi:hypothetical protein